MLGLNKITQSAAAKKRQVQSGLVFVDYSSADWTAVGNMALSNGNLTATPSVYGQYGAAHSAPAALPGNLYVEVRHTGFDGGASAVGIMPLASTLYSGGVAVPTGGVGHTVALGLSIRTYALVYNSVSGAYQILRDGVVVAAGTLLIPNPVIYVQGGNYNTTSVSTLNAGASAFIYEPVALP